jgi:hypothetical protein
MIAVATDEILYSAEVRVWDIPSASIVRRITIYSHSYHAIFSHTDSQLFIVSQNKLQNYNFPKGQENGTSWTSNLRSTTAAYTADNQHIITSDESSIRIFDVHALWRGVQHEYKGYYYWTTLSDGSSYAFRNDNWVYRFTQFTSVPEKVLYIPKQYRGRLAYNNDNSQSRVIGPLFSLSADLHYVQACIPGEGGLVTFLIPHLPDQIA